MGATKKISIQMRSKRSKTVGRLFPRFSESFSKTIKLLENDLKDSRLSLTNIFISGKQMEDKIDTAVNFWEEDIIPKRFGR